MTSWFAALYLGLVTIGAAGGDGLAHILIRILNTLWCILSSENV
jgi:hypothetical protein